jgi:hypothetical protein
MRAANMAGRIAHAVGAGRPKLFAASAELRQPNSQRLNDVRLYLTIDWLCKSRNSTPLLPRMSTVAIH